MKIVFELKKLTQEDFLWKIENNATQGTSFAVSIINDELILENEYAGIFLRLKRK